MDSENHHRIKVDQEGNLVVPPAIARKYGLKPGIELNMVEREGEIYLYQPISHLSKIYIEPTSQCNLSCRTCIRSAWDEPMGLMTADTFKKLLKSIASLDHPPSIFFGGFGEPLSHPEIIDMVRQVKQFSSRVELITNGILLTEECSRALIQAGLNSIWVSVDGASPESYADIRIGAALSDIFRNITQYRDQFRLTIGGEPDIGLVFVAMKRNIADLPELIRMSTKLGVSRYLVTNILPYTPEMCQERLYDRSVDVFSGAASPWAPRLDFPQLDVSQDTREPLIRLMSIHRHHFLLDNNLNERRDQCPFIRQGSTAIAWDGNLSPCLPLMHQHQSYLLDIRRVVHRYVVGNIMEQDLLTLWESPEFVSFRKRVDEFDFAPCTVCASCEMVESNQEDCFGNKFPTCGGCLWAQGFIRCP